MSLWTADVDGHCWIPCLTVQLSSHEQIESFFISNVSTLKWCFPDWATRTNSYIYFPQFISWKLSEESQTQQQVLDKNEAPIRIMLPFKDQKSSDAVLRQLADLSWKTNATIDIGPVYSSYKIKDEIKAREDKPPLVNQQCVVYHFQCNLCYVTVGYMCVSYMCQHLYQRIEDHNGTAIRNHLRDQHN